MLPWGDNSWSARHPTVSTRGPSASTSGLRGSESLDRLLLRISRVLATLFHAKCAAGALASGGVAQLAIQDGASPADAYRLVIVGYAMAGIALALLFSRVSARVEVPAGDVTDQAIRTRLGLHRSQRVVLRLSALFALDAFAGGFVIAGFITLWFKERFGVDPAALGALIFGANLLAVEARAL